jgi:hypothetical protein
MYLSYLKINVIMEKDKGVGYSELLRQSLICLLYFEYDELCDNEST